MIIILNLIISNTYIDNKQELWEANSMVFAKRGHACYNIAHGIYVGHGSWKYSFYH